MRTDTDVISGQTEAADGAFHGADTDVMTDRGSRWACHGADRCYDRSRQQMGLSWVRHRCCVRTDRGSRWACHGADTHVMTDRGSRWACHGQTQML